MNSFIFPLNLNINDEELIEAFEEMVGENYIFNDTGANKTVANKMNTTTTHKQQQPLILQTPIRFIHYKQR